MLRTFRCTECGTRIWQAGNPVQCQRCGGKVEASPSDVPSALYEKKIEEGTEDLIAGLEKLLQETSE